MEEISFLQKTDIRKPSRDAPFFYESFDTPVALGIVKIEPKEKITQNQNSENSAKLNEEDNAPSGNGHQKSTSTTIWVSVTI